MRSRIAAETGKPFVHSVVLLAMLLALVVAAQSSDKSAAQELPPGSAALVQPDELVKSLRGRTQKPIILYVGPRFLYAQAHIPGAEFIGPASDAQSLERLRQRVATLPKNSSIVLYCGCCPWDHCPNIRPAYQEAKKLGFDKTKALYLANNFGTDWVDKGYPVEKGEPKP